MPLFGATGGEWVGYEVLSGLVLDGRREGVWVEVSSVEVVEGAVEIWGGSGTDGWHRVDSERCGGTGTGARRMWPVTGEAVKLVAKTEKVKPAGE